MFCFSSRIYIRTVGLSLPGTINARFVLHESRSRAVSQAPPPPCPSRSLSKQAGYSHTGSVPSSGSGPGLTPPMTNGAYSGLPSTCNPFASSAPASAPAFVPAPPTATGPAATPVFAFVTATAQATGTATVGVPSAPAAAPTPATLSARAVDGSKSQETDSRGPTSNRSRRRIGP